MTDAFTWVVPYLVSCLKGLAVIQLILQKSFHVSTMSHILDDFIFLSQSESDCRGYLHEFQTVADYVGVPVKHSKTV